MDQSSAHNSEQQTATPGYADFLGVTRAMQEALIRNDAEGFSSLVDQRDAVIAAIGHRAPATADEKRCLYEAAKVDAEIEGLVAKLWNGLVGDLQQLATGRKAASAYYRSMSRRDPEDNSKFVDKQK